MAAAGRASVVRIATLTRPAPESHLTVAVDSSVPRVSTDGEPFLNTKSVPAGITHGRRVADHGGVVPG